MIVESEPLCDLQTLAFEHTDTGLQAYALPATDQSVGIKIIILIIINTTIFFAASLKTYPRLLNGLLLLT